MVVPRRNPRPAFKVGYWLGCLELDETRSCDQGAEHGHRVQISA